MAENQHFASSSSELIPPDSVPQHLRKVYSIIWTVVDRDVQTRRKAIYKESRIRVAIGVARSKVDWLCCWYSSDQETSCEDGVHIHM